MAHSLNISDKTASGGKQETMGHNRPALDSDEGNALLGEVWNEYKTKG